MELSHCSGTNAFAGVYLEVISWSDLECLGIAHLINRCPCRVSGQQERCEMQGITLGNFLNRSAIRRNGDWLSRC